MSFVSQPLVPKNPNGPLRVLVVGRISTTHQNIENIDASYRYVDEFLSRIYQGSKEIRHLGEQGSGMRTDRATIVEAEEEIMTGAWDLVITEDLSRFYRNPRHQYAFVQDAVDHDTRVICIGDNLDTADENWEGNMGAATLRHGLFVPDTRRRVKRTATHSFHGGGMVQKIRFGYRKLKKAEAVSGAFGPKGLRIAKKPEDTPIIQQMRAMILAGSGYQEVAEWLNDQQIKPGNYVTSGRWQGKTVEMLLRDPILSGTRTFRKVVHKVKYKTGKHRRSKNPNELETEYYAELAHLSREEHQEMLDVMDVRRKTFGERKRGRESPLFNRPRGLSIWPGLQMYCAACGGVFYWGCDGRLQCKHASKGPNACWNHVHVSAEQAREKVLTWLLSALDQNPQFHEALVEAAWVEYSATMRRFQRADSKLDDQIKSLQGQAANLAKAIAAGGNLPALVEQLRIIEVSLADARKKRASLESEQEAKPRWMSRDELAAQLAQAVMELVRTSLAFGSLLRRVFPQFQIHVVKALDNNYLRPRAKITLRLSALANPKATDTVDDIHVTLDLFEPPVHIRYIQACVAEKTKNKKLRLRDIAANLGINYMTVKRALDYARWMEREGMQEPYLDIQTQPVSASRWLRRS